MSSKKPIVTVKETVVTYSLVKIEVNMQHLDFLFKPLPV